MREIIDLHDKYMLYVSDCFANSSLFHKALKEAFESFCNKSVAGSSIAELMANFCDNLLRKVTSLHTIVCTYLYIVCTYLYHRVRLVCFAQCLHAKPCCFGKNQPLGYQGLLSDVAAQLCIRSCCIGLYSCL